MKGQIYLVHFDEGLPIRRHPKSGVVVHATHYIGWTQSLDRRLDHHAKGSGSALMAAVSRQGISWRVVRLWEGTRDDERRIKKRKESPRFCPVCVARSSVTRGLLDPGLVEIPLETTNGPEGVREPSGPPVPKAGAGQDMERAPSAPEILPSTRDLLPPTP